MLTLDLTKKSGILDLNKEAPNFKTLKGTLKWKEHPKYKDSLTEGFDLDIFVYILDSNQKIQGAQDVVYFNNQKFGEAIFVPIDNRFGGEEYFESFLEKMPSTKDHVDIFVFIHEAQKRGQTFGMIQDASFDLFDVEKNNQIVKYAMSGYTNETALHIGRFSRNGSGWTFEPSGAVAVADPNQVASGYL